MGLEGGGDMRVLEEREKAAEAAAGKELAAARERLEDVQRKGQKEREEVEQDVALWGNVVEEEEALLKLLSQQHAAEKEKIEGDMRGVDERLRQVRNSPVKEPYYSQKSLL